ncbi:DUF2188 domain-containing protein [Phenylobacterium deserti]|uniref:DUF2188 domain-containing protein n=1 Tax=Phenylobacterium deserti TaxID=1914756 RepID=A0A328ANG2_9CAUL|nr:DUF2188 domain-containing protein [Phenylobacterium deserti]RAK56470.1 hypothetical protein DJ018_00335 [Phenylobacterium deserti]
MRNEPARLTFTVRPHNGGWAVEHAGEYLDSTRNKDEAKAAANKRARAAQDAGQACIVRITGEHGFFGAA